MPASARFIIAAAALLAAVGVACGAFGAHALKQRLSPELLSIWQTAVQYHLWHALGLLAIGIIAVHMQRPLVTAAAGLLVIGVALFSGSLYALALGAPRQVGVVTPFGGLGLIAGWLCLAAAAWRA